MTDLELRDILKNLYTTEIEAVKTAHRQKRNIPNEAGLTVVRRDASLVFFPPNFAFSARLWIFAVTSTVVLAAALGYHTVAGHKSGSSRSAAIIASNRGGAKNPHFGAGSENPSNGYTGSARHTSSDSITPRKSAVQAHPRFQPPAVENVAKPFIITRAQMELLIKLTGSGAPPPSEVTTANAGTMQTDLLFPYITAQGGFENGVAIANTSTDSFAGATCAGTAVSDGYIIRCTYSDGNGYVFIPTLSPVPTLFTVEEFLKSPLPYVAGVPTKDPLSPSAQ
jgi:hypothetical protein